MKKASTLMNKFNNKTNIKQFKNKLMKMYQEIFILIKHHTLSLNLNKEDLIMVYKYKGINFLTLI
jgi:hypothetical protein